MTLGVFRGLLTLALFLSFAALWMWAWRKDRQPDFAAAARLPLIEDQPVETRQRP